MFGELPAVLIVGPRAAGKTTTAARHARSVVRLDEPAEAVAFRADPDAALRQFPEPVLLDEWQVVPGVLGAIKRSVDARPGSGRFLVTGSVRADLQAENWPGTGRLVRVAMSGLSLREIAGRVDGPSFVDRIAEAGVEALSSPADPPDLPGYLGLALRGGFPEPALRLSAARGQEWLESYLDQLLTRDVELLGESRDPDRLRRYVEVLALNSAGIVANRTVFEAARINAKTADAYDGLLRNLLVVDSLPSWWTNRLKRLVQVPKRYVVDPALIGAALRVDVRAVLRDGDLLGRLLDTLVVAQLRAEVPVSASRPRLFHLRQEGGRHEVDVLVELGGGRVIGVEVKADAGPGRDAARHLAWLRDELGDRFVAGVVLHT
ncbi:ATP-binding protein, partial [Frankia canadensis]|uniref:ATP-binding protein n=1 Tax=Frankia canadensis TaxID=1836972 RepID=UPI001FAE90F8